MMFALVIPLFLQGALIVFDEFFFHYRRGLPRWERIGHPIDTLGMVLCVGLCILFPFDSHMFRWFIGLSVFSCLLITKDEWVHVQKCTAGEMWIHALLFVLHPLALISIGILWWKFPDQIWILKIECGLLILFMIYQTLFWNFIASSQKVNNEFYDDLGEQWYHAQNHPVALLRAESRLFVDWIDAELRKTLSSERAVILDVGCGGGLLSNELAKRGWKITAVDLSEESLKIAKRFDDTGSVDYKIMNAEKMNLENEKFDAVISLDMLEHVENPGVVISECSRVLKKDGLFFFHTFNRTFFSWLFVIKGIDWFVQNAPEHLHIYKLFITLQEFEKYCADANLSVRQMRGVSPIFRFKTLAPLLLRGRISKDFAFQFTHQTNMGYAGFAVKQS